MEHHFNVEIACKVGVQAAVLLNHIAFWVAHNMANGTNFYEGRYWTFNSKKAFAELFPYMTERQVQYALDKLKAEEYILTGNFNKLNLDKTLWYTLTDKAIEQNCLIEQTKLSNRLNKIVEPIPDNKTTNNIYIDKPKKAKAFVPPTLEEVQAYVASRNSIVDAKAFFEFYDVGHWVDSNGKPVKNWKQKLLTWEKNSKNTNQPQEPVRPKAEAPKINEDTIGSSFFDEFNN